MAIDAKARPTGQPVGGVDSDSTLNYRPRTSRARDTMSRGTHRESKQANRYVQVEADLSMTFWGGVL